MSLGPCLAQQRARNCCRLPGSSSRPSSSSTLPRRVSVQVRAQGDKVDWDKEWNSFANEKQRSNGTRQSVRTTIPVDPAAKMTRDRIKREESILLNAWSSGAFQGAGAAAAVIVLLVILLAAGPPPADSRCTLPWC